MDMQNRKHKRNGQKLRTILLVILALIIGLVIGVIFTIALSQDYTIVISNSEEIETQKPVENRSISPIFNASMTEKPVSEEKVTKNNKIVVIDAGHQLKGNFSKEPIAPGASETKAKVAGGTSGVATKVPEYQVNLDVALLLEEELKARGYDVVMIRRTNDVDISNSKRAMIANDAEADVFIRIHCNGAQNDNAKGALTMCQTPNNQYCGDLYKQSRLLSERVLESLCQQTGAKNLGVSETDDMSGINWCRVPVTIVEMGFMTNPEEDKKLCDPSYQKSLAIGITNGIDAYLNSDFSVYEN